MTPTLLRFFAQLPSLNGFCRIGCAASMPLAVSERAFAPLTLN
jgi:hypothetical protein